MTQVTHTEILTLAIDCIDTRIAEVDKMLGPAPSQQMEDMVAKVRKPLNDKRQMLVELYKIETGTDYE